MKTVHLPKQNEIHILPVYEKLSESELDVIAHENGLEKYEVDERQTFDMKGEKPKFEYFTYIFKSKEIL